MTYLRSHPQLPGFILSLFLHSGPSDSARQIKGARCTHKQNYEDCRVGRAEDGEVDERTLMWTLKTGSRRVIKVFARGDRGQLGLNPLL